MPGSTNSALTLLMLGDNILGPDADTFFAPSLPVLKSADVLAGQLEVPYTIRQPEAVTLGRDPANLTALAAAGFDIVTLAGNHILDAGVAGIQDSLAWLSNHNIASTGAGMDLSAARSPAIVDREGTRVGFLAYNCVGPKETWATATKPGCAFVSIITHYELDHANPGGPPSIYTWAEPRSLEAMCDDIRALRSRCEIVVVSLHKGLVHVPVKLADYEKQVAHAAADAGADLVVGQHAHILKGVEVYRGTPIFHGMCNFVAWLPSLAPKPGQDPQSWAQRRRELFGFEPNPEYPTYPFHPEAKYTIIAKCRVEEGRIARTSYLPCIVNKRGQPEVVGHDAGGQQVFDYMLKITRVADLNAKFEWQGDEILIRE